MISRDAIITELSEIKAMLADNRLKDEDRFALFGAVQALSHVLDPKHGSHPARPFTSLVLDRFHRPATGNIEGGVAHRKFKG